MIFDFRTLFCTAFAVMAIFKPLQSQNPPMLGYWLNLEYANDLFYYYKSDSFVPKNSGIEFLPEGRLVIRQNSSFCGTPPIGYLNYNGKWKFKSDSVLKLQYDFWGGEIKSLWKIKELSDEKMVIDEIKVHVIYKNKFKKHRNIRYKQKGYLNLGYSH